MSYRYVLRDGDCCQLKAKFNLTVGFDEDTRWTKRDMGNHRIEYIAKCDMFIDLGAGQVPVYQGDYVVVGAWS